MLEGSFADSHSYLFKAKGGLQIATQEDPSLSLANYFHLQPKYRIITNYRL